MKAGGEWRTDHNSAMRINLKTPFAEKDEAKALGARWDPKKKCWYIQNVADLSPFARWITDSPASTSPMLSSSAAAGLPLVPARRRKRQRRPGRAA